MKYLFFIIILFLGIGRVDLLAQTEQVFPWVTQNASFSSRMIVDNLSTDATEVTLTAIRATGESETVALSIAPLDQLVADVDQLFTGLGEGSGYAVFMSSTQVDTFGSMVVSGRNSLSGDSPGQANALPLTDMGKNWLFTYLPTGGFDGYISAPVLVNNSNTDAQVTYYAYASGFMLDQTTRTIPAGRPYAETTDSLFPGVSGDLYVVAQSSEDVAAMAFVFNANGEPSLAMARALTRIPAVASDGGTDDGGDADDGTLENGLPAMYAHFEDNVTVFLEGNTIVVQSDGLPNHGSPYWGNGHSNYESPHAGMVVNPNRIAEQDLEMRVPFAPEIASNPSETDLGTIGIAVNGVSLFNQYAGRTATGWVPLEGEIDTFDVYNGHPQRTGNYHYHLEPVYITNDAPWSLVGVMQDGFPIYGPQEPDGSYPSDLDDCNGHFGPTPDHPNGVYHYHVTAAEPYLVGCFKGQPGTISN
jgi:hypothetical protein